jgi:hypothetical protein
VPVIATWDFRPELGQFSAYLSARGCGQARRGGRAGDLRR